MAKFRQLASVGILLAALGLYWSRSSIANRRRTVQSTELMRSSPNNDGFSFRLGQRANNSESVPISVLYGTCYPHATGAYKGRSGSPPLHIHRQDDEEFTVLAGVMGYIENGKEGLVQKGETVTLAAGIPHTFWNANPDKPFKNKIRLINRSGKPSVSDRFFEQWAGIAFDHGGIDNVNPLQLLLTLDAGGVDLAVPLPAKLLIKYLALPLGRLVGFQPFYSEYVLP